MSRPSDSEIEIRRRAKGFERASSLLQQRVRKASETRGFAESRLLTHWAEVVGQKTADMALPVKVSYAQGGFGATLTLLTTGSMAPILQAELPTILEKVNACYGYAAISRLRITQTAPTGFAEGQVAFRPAPPAAQQAADPQVRARAGAAVEKVNDDDLRQALEALGQNVLSRHKRQGESS